MPRETGNDNAFFKRGRKNPKKEKRKGRDAEITVTAIGQRRQKLSQN
jgi:hypothetical protein